MGKPSVWARVGFLVAVFATACEPSGEVATNENRPSNDGVSPELEKLARALAGDDVRIARVLDHDGSRWALGVERGDAALKASKPPSGTDATPSVLLLILDSKQKSAQWPIGARRVLDAALASESPQTVGFIDADGQPCLTTGWAPTCAELRAEPAGMDVSNTGQLVFAAADGLGTHLFEVSAADAAPRRLTKGPTHHDRPMYDPEGKRVVFVGSGGGLASLFLVDVEKQSVMQLTNVGKKLEPLGEGSRIPKDFVPPPDSRSQMSWDSTGIHYTVAGIGWHVDPVSGDASQEVPR